MTNHASTYSPPRSRPFRNERGTVLIVAMILAVIIGISLVSFLKLSNSSLNISQRNFYDNSAMNLCETGLERALYCLNQNQVNGLTIANSWTTAEGWTLQTTTQPHEATCTFTETNIGPNVTGTIKVYVKYFDLTTSNPVVIVSKSSVSLPNGPPLSKFVEITLDKRNMFAGLVAKNSLRGDSNLRADSWVSTPSPGVYTPYSSGIATAGGPLGVVATGNGALNVGDNATVAGTISTGGGTISKSGSSKLTSTVGGSGWNTGLENKSFTYTFPAIVVPTPDVVNTMSANVTLTETFPRPGDSPASDGKYYYNFAAGKGINYSSGTMTITKPVVFLMQSHSGVNAIYTSSAATFRYGIAAGDTTSQGSFNVYTNGNINFDSGANWFQNKAPVNTGIYGTNPTSQSIVTRGGGTFYGSIIAENATIQFDSGTNIMGAFCCKDMTLLGGVNFHYDQSLGQVGGGGYKVTQWKELQSATERAVYNTALNF
jgi:Tfp pilus assembly protein PilX